MPANWYYRPPPIHKRATYQDVHSTINEDILKIDFYFAKKITKLY